MSEKLWEQKPLDHKEEQTMSKAGKKYTDAAKLIEAGKAYSPKEAVDW